MFNFTKMLKKISVIISPSRRLSRHRGFTLVELIVSLSIFAFMTALVLAKYGTFNEDVLITNLAYDTAVTIRSAQAYALNVRDTGATAGAVSNNNFSNAYGVHFDMTHNTSFVFFVNSGIETYANPDNAAATSYVSTISQTISTYTMKTGNTIVRLCANIDTTPCPTSGAGNLTQADVVFRRPYPDAILTGTANGVPSTVPSVEIVVGAADGTTKNIIVRQTGQIQISN